MNAMLNIRKNVFGFETQAEMAAISGVSQGTVSKWEKGVHAPGKDDLQRIRDAAVERGLPWDDRWFFETPAPPAEVIAP